MSNRLFATLRVLIAIAERNERSSSDANVFLRIEIEKMIEKTIEQLARATRCTEDVSRELLVKSRDTEPLSVINKCIRNQAERAAPKIAPMHWIFSSGGIFERTGCELGYSEGTLVMVVLSRRMRKVIQTLSVLPASKAHPRDKDTYLIKVSKRRTTIVDSFFCLFRLYSPPVMLLVKLNQTFCANHTEPRI